MADTSQLRKTEPVNFSEDDPFAELTRIMGFDPREAVKKSAPSPEFQAANTPAAPAMSAAPAPVARAPEPVADPQAVAPADPQFDDFGIDLEKELLGEFADEPMAAAPAPVAVQHPAAYPSMMGHHPAAAQDDDELDAAFSESFDAESFEDELHLDEHDLLGDLDLSMDEPDVEVVAAPRDERRVAHEDEHFAEVDMDFGADFESEMLAELDAQPQRAVLEQPRAVAAASPALELEDELNALLANAVPHTTVGMPRQPEARTSVSAEQVARWARTNYPLASGAFERSQPVSYQQPAPVAAVAEPDPEPEYEPEQAYEEAAAITVAAEDNLDDLLDVMTAEVLAPEDEEAHAQLPEYDHTPFTVDASAYRGDGGDLSARDEDDAPDVETYDVPEAAVAYADDLDLPEINYDEPDSQRPVYDDLESDFASVFNEPSAPEPQTAQRVAANAAQPVDFDADFDTLYRQVREAAAGTSAYAGPARQPAVAVNSNEPVSALDEDPFAAIGDEDFEEDMELRSHAAETVEPAAQRRGMMIAAVVGGVALLGGVGAFALSFGGSGGNDVPVVVQADGEPVKVKPENPGGTSVPNQDNKVFETMAAGGSQPGAPAQEKLVSTTEEPVDIAASDPGARAVDPVTAGQTAEDTAGLPLAPKSEDRIEPTAVGETTNEDIVAVAPRKVKTMVVRSDGTLVPREEAAPAPSTVAAAPVSPALAPALDATPIVAPASETTGTTVPTPTLRAAEAEAPAATETTGTTAAAPEPAPLAPVVEQPVEAAPEQVAVAAPTEAPLATAGSWSMQIASQPSAESAQSTYEDLARRYGGVIGGRGVNIVKAEIAGKGTYWRVRIPAETRNDAIKLCESYKAAGGNCFVSK